MKKKFTKLLGTIFITFCFLFAQYSSCEAFHSGLVLNEFFYKEWLHGGTFGEPLFIRKGCFLENLTDQLLMVSRVPDETYVITAMRIEDNDLVSLGSKDKDCLQIYQYIIADFDGDNDEELFTSEDSTNDMGVRVGSLHRVHDIQNHRIIKNTTLFSAKPECIMELGDNYDIDNNADDEMIIAGWDMATNEEFVRILDYQNQSFTQVTNITNTYSENYLQKTVTFVACGHFTQKNEIEILTISQYILATDPTHLHISFQLYSYNKENNQIIKTQNGELSFPSYQIRFLTYDYNFDEKLELITYCDQISEPELSLYSFSDLGISKTFSIIRDQSNYDETNWIAIDLLISSVDFDLAPELVIVEQKLGTEGRLETYEIQETQFISEGIHELQQPSSGATLANIGLSNKPEFVSIFNTKLSNTTTKLGGLEILSFSPNRTQKFPISILPIFISFLFYVVIKKRSNKRTLEKHFI